jgi:hypothetical protein
MDKTIRVWDFTSFLSEVLPEWEETGVDSEADEEDDGDVEEKSATETITESYYDPSESFYSSRHDD